MSIAIIIIQIVIILGIAYFSHYFQEKGKNLATKEDISEITAKIEQVKHEYSSKLESVKNVLSARLFAHQVRYQNEFVMLLSLSEKLAEFRNAIADFEIQVSSLGEDNPNYTKQVVEKLGATMKALQREYEGHMPFYPQHICESVRKLHSLGWTKFVMQADKANLIEKNKFSEIIVEMAEERNQSLDAKEISEIIDKIYEAIRKRVEYWEELNIE